MSLADMVFDGAFASACATVVSNPFDVVRTRMQLQGELKRAGEYEVIYKNLLQATVKIAKDEGILSLQKGLVPAVLFQIVLNGIRIGSYPLVKIHLGNGLDALQARYHAVRADRRTNAVEPAPLSESYLFLIRAVAGSLCGIVGMTTASPLNMVKTRLQSEHSPRVALSSSSSSSSSSSLSTSRSLSQATTGTQFGYTGVWDGLCKVYAKGGLRGLWHGAGIGAQRSLLASPIQLVSYDYCRAWWGSWLGYPVSDIRMHILAAINASFFVTVCMNPFDVVMTRAYNTRVADKAQRVAGVNTISYNIGKQVLNIYRVEGVRGMYKGSVALFARSAPHNVVTFVVLEWVRKMREKHLPSRAYTSGSNLSRGTPSRIRAAGAAGTSASHTSTDAKDGSAMFDNVFEDPEEFIVTPDVVISISDT